MLSQRRRLSRADSDSDSARVSDSLAEPPESQSGAAAPAPRRLVTVTRTVALTRHAGAVTTVGGHHHHDDHDHSTDVSASSVTVPGSESDDSVGLRRGRAAARMIPSPDAVGDSLAGELGDSKRVEPVMDWDRPGGDRGPGTIRRRSASRRSGRVGVGPRQRGRTGVWEPRRGVTSRWRASHWSRAVWAAVRRAW